MKKLSFLLAAVLLLSLIPAPAYAGEAPLTAELYIMAGQSNAVGSSAIPESASFGQTENVLYYGSTDRSPTTTGSMHYDLKPVRLGLGAWSERAGFELGLADVLSKLGHYKDGTTKAVIVKYASGGSSVTEEWTYGSWYPPTLLAQDYPDRDYSRTGADYYNLEGYQYRVLLEEITNCVEKLKSKGYEQVNVRGIFWMQGESDTDRVSRYKTVLPVMIEDLRTDIGAIVGQDCSKLPFYIGEISRTFASAEEGIVRKNEAMIEVQNQIAMETPYTYIGEFADIAMNKIDSRGFTTVVGSDSCHWNYYDICQIGKEFAELFLRTGADFDGYEMLDSYVHTSVIGDAACTISFPTESRGNYNASTESMVVELQTQAGAELTDLTVQNATLRKLETVFQDTEEVDTDREGRTMTPIHRYELTDMTGEVTLEATVGESQAYTVEVVCEDMTYGFAPYKSLIDKQYYAGCRYRLQTAPQDKGAVKMLLLNGKTVTGEADQWIFELDGLETYADEDGHIKIEIVYDSKENVENYLKLRPLIVPMICGGAGVAVLLAAVIILLAVRSKKRRKARAAEA